MKRVNIIKNSDSSGDDFEDDQLTSRRKKLSVTRFPRKPHSRTKIKKSPCGNTVDQIKVNKNQQRQSTEQNKNNNTPGTSQYSSSIGENSSGIGSYSISENEQSKQCDYCPVCQMPFSALHGDSAYRHVTECINFPIESQTDADISPDSAEGASASNMNLSSNYRHDLGEAMVDNDSCQEVSTTSIDPSLSTEITLSLSESKQITPLLGSPLANSCQKRKKSRRLKPTKEELNKKGQRSILEFFPSQNLSKKQTNSALQESRVSDGLGSSCLRSDTKCADLDISASTISRRSVFLGYNLRNIHPVTSGATQLKKNSKMKKQYVKYEAKHSTRSCPFYKRIPGTPFTVDAFSYGTIPDCTTYFLTHFHYDHYQGLTRTFSHPIYCSKITANLVEKKIRVNTKHLHRLDIDKAYYIHDVEVTLLDANHCPGSVMVLFKLKNGQVILHTGDFRASDSMQEYTSLKGLHVNKLFLDTTYCDPDYCFPSQQSVIDFTVQLSTTFINSNPRGVVVVGSYTIGKEKIFLAISEALDCKICVSSEKKRVLSCLEDQHMLRRLTLNAREAKVHVLPMNKLSYKGLSSYLVDVNFDRVLAFEPTGWTHTEKSYEPKISKNGVTLYGVPYSEHSSFEEMKNFVCYLHPDKIIPTVNNSRQSVKKMEKYFANWLSDTSCIS